MAPTVYIAGVPSRKRRHLSAEEEDNSSTDEETPRTDRMRDNLKSPQSPREADQAFHVTRHHTKIWVLDGRALRNKLFELQAQMGVMTGERRHMSQSESDSESEDSSLYVGHTALEHESMKSEGNKVWISNSVQDSERKRDLEARRQRCLQTTELLRRSGLLDITIKTAELVRRNHQLQRQLMTLQAETRAFVHSVLNNPENKRLRLGDSVALKPGTASRRESCESPVYDSVFTSENSNDSCASTIKEPVESHSSKTVCSVFQDK